MVGNYAAWLRHESSYWEYFDKAIKLSGTIDYWVHHRHPWNYFKFPFTAFCKKNQIMENNIKKLKAFQHTRTFICDLFNLANCVKQALKTFEVAHFWVNSLAHGAFSSFKPDKRIRTLYVMFCTIWYHLYNLKNMKNTNGGILLLVKFY